MTLTNTSSHELTFFDRNPICDYPIKIQDSDGKQPPETTAKKQAHCEGEFRLTAGRNILITLKPGDSFEDEITVSFYYRLQRPGTYTVQVCRHLPGEISKEDISSNTATFTVIV